MTELFQPVFDSWKVKMLGGNMMIPVSLSREGDRLFLEFGFNEALKNDIKLLDGSKWHGKDKTPRKAWSIKDNSHNRFQIKYLVNPGNTPLNPYYVYDQPWKSFTTTRPLYNHQRSMTAHGISTHYCIWAAEMGVGKSLSAIEVMEWACYHQGVYDCFWVGPQSAIVSAKLECKNWKSKITPQFFTYEGLQKEIENWPSGRKSPMVLIIDECSRCKNPTAKRTIAVQYMADAIRREWGDKGFVIEMSGTPTPKDPTDWWSLAEIACPGFLIEGTREILNKRLSIIEHVERTVGGGTYPQRVTWKDDERKCNICGLFKDAETHSGGVDVFQTNSMICHPYQKSVNEVAYLGTRLKGLAQVIYKKDCLDLPPKIYREVELQPTLQIQNLAELIKAKSSTAIEALTLLRELSDGFQYRETVTGKETCPLCIGKRTVLAPVYSDDTTEEDIQAGTANYELQERACDKCNGIGSVDKITRTVYEIPTPKEDALIELLDEFEEVGRFIICAGFTASIDRVIKICEKEKWATIKIDGRSWSCSAPHIKTREEMIEAFQDKEKKIPRLVTVMHPASGGMGLTLTASPAMLYYSNDFNSESREQSEDRGHRPSMNIERGFTIIDLFHLPSDRKVRDNLKAKKNLMHLTMNEI